ncbi:MAG TPA: tetratricopeptide repeat protein [Candidatus Didemnitutus sp.]|nr:tetratricopeptide repeat protein [Candidatus Didemnitutus sp.]
MPTLRSLLFFAFVSLTGFAIAAPDSPLKTEVTTLFRGGKWDEARAVCEKALAADPKNAEAQFYLGMSYLSRNDYEHATPELEKATELAPTNSEYFRRLGEAYGSTAQNAGLFSKMSWAKKCKAAFEKAVELDPKNIRARQSLMDYLRQAPGIAGGSMEQAYVQAAEIQKLDLNQGRIAYATLYVVEKKYNEAFAIYEDVLKQKPDDYAALYAIGRLSAVSGERLDQGVDALKKCLAAKAPDGQPGPAPVNWRLGNIWEKKGDKAAAKSAYEAALAVDPNFSQAADALKKLQ